MKIHSEHQSYSPLPTPLVFSSFKQFDGASAELEAKDSKEQYKKHPLI